MTPVMRVRQSGCLTMPLMQNPLSKRCHFCFSFVVTVLLTIGILDIMAGAIWFLLALAAGRT